MATETIKTPGNIGIVFATNERRSELVNSGRVTDFNPSFYKTTGVDGNGNESPNVPLADAKGINDTITPNGVIKVMRKFVEIKGGAVKVGDKEYQFVYDNVLKEIPQAFKVGDNEKLIQVDENEFLIEPLIKGKTLNKRVEVIEALTKLVIKAFNQDKDTVLKEEVVKAIRLAIGNIKAQNVDIENIKTLRDKAVFLKEVFSKIDFNSGAFKNYYMEMKEDSEIGELFPTLKNLKDENYVKKAFTMLGIKGLALKDFRELTKTQDRLGKNADLEDIDYFNEIQKAKEEYGIETEIRNLNTTYVGIDEKGNIVIFKDNAIKLPSNGAIYKNYGLAEKLGNVNKADYYIKQAVFHPDEIDKTKVVEAENLLKTEVQSVLDNEKDEFLKKEISALLAQADVNKLYTDEKYKVYNNVFRRLADHVERAKKREVRREVLQSIFLLTQDGTRVRNMRFASKPLEGKEGGLNTDVLDEDSKVENIAEYRYAIPVPVLSSFSGKGVFEKIVGANVFGVYIDEEKNQIVQTNNSTYVYSMRAELKLGRILNTLMNKEIKEGNIEGFKNALLKYFYANKDEKSIKVSDNFKKTVDNFLKEPLSKVIDALDKKDVAKAKEIIKGWENSEDENLKTFSKWIKKAGEVYPLIKDVNSIQFALSNFNESEQKVINNFLKNPTVENLEAIKTHPNKSVRKTANPLVRFIGSMTKGKNIIEAFNQEYIQKLFEMNGGVDEKDIQWFVPENIAKSIGYALATEFDLKVYRKDENGQLYSALPNPVDSYRRKTDENIVEYKKVEFNGKTVQIADLNEKVFNETLKEREELAKAVSEAVDKKFGEIYEVAAKRPEFNRKTKEYDENIVSESFSIGAFAEDENEEINVEEDETVENDEKPQKTLFKTVEDDVDIDDDLDIPDDFSVDPDQIVKQKEIAGKKSNISAAKKAGL